MRIFDIVISTDPHYLLVYSKEYGGFLLNETVITNSNDFKHCIAYCLLSALSDYKERKLQEDDINDQYKSLFYFFRFQLKCSHFSMKTVQIYPTALKTRSIEFSDLVLLHFEC